MNTAIVIALSLVVLAHLLWLAALFVEDDNETMTLIEWGLWAFTIGCLLGVLD